MIETHIISAVDKLLNDDGSLDLLPHNESINYTIDSLRGDKYQKGLDKLLDGFKDLSYKDGKIVMYRAIGHNLDNIHLKELGICWTWNIRKAYAYRARNQEQFYYLYHALCQETDINWIHTIQKKLSMYGHEQELKMIPNQPIEIFKIEKRQKTLETILDAWDVQYMAKI